MNRPVFSIAFGLALLTLTGAWCASAAEEVWKGDRIVDAPVTIQRKTLRIEPGSRIAFKGEGRITVEDGNLVATHAAFEARSTLTNRFRIVVQNGKLTLSNCRFRGLKTEKPDKAHFIYGFLRCQYGTGSRVEDCDFVDCDALMMLNASHAEFARNLSVRCVKTFATLNCSECRFEGNEFFETRAGLNLSGTRLSEVFRNRFTDCPIGLVLYYCQENRVLGNAFFGGNEGMQLWGLGPGGVFAGNRFETVKYPFSKRGKSDESNVFRDNDL